MQVKRKRGRPRLTPEQKLERQQAKIAKLAEADKQRKIRRQRKPNDEKISITKSTSFILTPAGRCPVQLHGFDKEAIRMWLQFAKNANLQENSYHTTESLTYWLRDFYSIFTEEYKIAKRNLLEVCPEFEITDLTAKWEKQKERIDKELAEEKNKNVNADV